jgi:hypothetical protein
MIEASALPGVEIGTTVRCAISWHERRNCTKIGDAASPDLLPIRAQ